MKKIICTLTAAAAALFALSCPRAAAESAVSVTVSSPEGVIYGSVLTLVAKTALPGPISWEVRYTGEETFLPLQSEGSALSLKDVADSGEYVAVLSQGETELRSEPVKALIAPRAVKLEFSYAEVKENGSPVLPACRVLGVLGSDDPLLVLEPDREPVKAGEYTVKAHLLNPNYSIDGENTYTYRIKQKFPWRDVGFGIAVAALMTVLVLHLYFRKRAERKKS